MEKLRNAAAAIVLGLSVASANAAGAVTIEVAFANHPEMYREIADQFMKEHPEVSVELLPPFKNYDELIQNLLRNNITGGLPDVAFQSVNRVDLLADKGVATALDQLIGAETNWHEQGYSDSLIETCRIGDAIYCLPFAISVPIIYYNPDLVRAAGGDPDHFPDSWEDINALAAKIQALGDDNNGIYFSYFNHSSNWTTTALITSRGGHLMSTDGKSIAFDSRQGMWMLDMMKSFGEAGQVDMSLDQARQAFAAGKLGILSTSSSHLATMEKLVGESFELRTAAWPIAKPEGRLPAGGNGISILTKDPAKQQAAWDFVKFATGPIGQTIMVRGSGYTPVNSLPLADAALLATYFDEHPNQRTAAEQAAVITRWQSFPGDNGVKASDVFRDHVQSVATLRRSQEDAMPDLVRDIQALLLN